MPESRAAARHGSGGAADSTLVPRPLIVPELQRIVGIIAVGASRVRLGGVEPLPSASDGAAPATQAAAAAGNSVQVPAPEAEDFFF